ncbi:MAG: hypothetical protein ACI8TV_001267 [Porticoccaceae bacterium]|jgi:hypothetical protein
MVPSQEIKGIIEIIVSFGTGHVLQYQLRATLRRIRNKQLSLAYSKRTLGA